MEGAARLARVLGRDGGKALRLAPRVRAKLKPSDVHDLRVLTRRLRAMIWVARRLNSPSACGKLRRALRRWGQALGEQRMLDVALEDAARYGLPAGALAARHAASGRLLRQELAAEHCRELAGLLRRAARKLARRGIRGQTGRLVCPRIPRGLAAGLAQRREGLRAALSAAPRGKEDLHRLRLEAKKMRYVLDALSLRGAVLKELQGHLGRVHDLEVLRQLLGDHPDVARDEARARDAALHVMRAAVARAERELRRLAPGRKEARNDG